MNTRTRVGLKQVNSVMPHGSAIICGFPSSSLGIRTGSRIARNQIGILTWDVGIPRGSLTDWPPLASSWYRGKVRVRGSNGWFFPLYNLLVCVCGLCSWIFTNISLLSLCFKPCLLCHSWLQDSQAVYLEVLTLLAYFFPWVRFVSCRWLEWG